MTDHIVAVGYGIVIALDETTTEKVSSYFELAKGSVVKDTTDLEGTRLKEIESSNLEVEVNPYSSEGNHGDYLKVLMGDTVLFTS